MWCVWDGIGRGFCKGGRGIGRGLILFGSGGRRGRGRLVGGGNVLLVVGGFVSSGFFSLLLGVWVGYGGGARVLVSVLDGGRRVSWIGFDNLTYTTWWWRFIGIPLLRSDLYSSSSSIQSRSEHPKVK